MKEWCVYKHTNKINNKIYIGITSQSPSLRWKNGWGYYNDNHEFFSDIQKFGWNDGFIHTILRDSITLSEAEKEEKHLIKILDTMNPKNGYNLQPGGFRGKPIKITFRPIIVVNANTWDIKQYDSIKYFTKEKHIKSSISSTIKKRALILKTYMVYYEEDVVHLNKKQLIEKTRDILSSKKYQNGKITQFDLDGNIINEFNSIREASVKTEIGETLIGGVCNRKFKHCNGFVFIRNRDLSNKDNILREADYRYKILYSNGDEKICNSRNETAAYLETTDNYIWEMIKNNKAYKKKKCKVFKMSDTKLDDKIKDYLYHKK